jgi:4'-phosphopantetheinyl transferase
VIHWLIQTTAAHPDLALGQAPLGLLSREETAVLAGFKVLKRRQDWLLGRWTAKLLLQEIIDQESGRSVPLDNIIILPGEDGAPRVTLSAAGTVSQPQFTLSISHSHGSSLCAAISRPDWPLGADIERIEARSVRFAADFFTAGEQAQVDAVGSEMYDTLVTAVWSAKEAALKAIRQGLRSDTRCVGCHFNVSREAAPFPISENGRASPWHAFQIEWQHKADQEQQPALDGWWMVSGGFVHTLAVGVIN